jgi:hypothetical protein
MGSAHHDVTPDKNGTNGREENRLTTNENRDKRDGMLRDRDGEALEGRLLTNGSDGTQRGHQPEHFGEMDNGDLVVEGNGLLSPLMTRDTSTVPDSQQAHGDWNQSSPSLI